MRILLLIHAFNSLSQRAHVELRQAGHQVSVEFFTNDDLAREAVALWRPDLILCTYLKRAVPADIWRATPTLIVHPGPPGDRGPAALDWAILRGAREWGVTVLEAREEMDAGPIWAWRRFPMRAATKSSLYRNKVSDGAMAAIFEALEKIAAGARPVPLEEAEFATGCLNGPVRQSDRAIDWARDRVMDVLGKMHASDGVPGVADNIDGRRLLLHDGHPAPGLSGPPGALLAVSGPAVALACADGAVWIGHMRDPAAEVPVKLPARQVLGEVVHGLAEVAAEAAGAYPEIAWREEGDVGWLSFSFLNGAMSTGQCARLLTAFHRACTRPVKVIVLEGGPDFWSNGIHLNRIEAAASPAEESWANINAMDDLAEALIRCETHLTVAAMAGNAGAGGVFLARACDRVWLREGVILNPHYKDMGNLYGSEFWTYLLPRCCGAENARRIADARLPMGAAEARALGLADAVLPSERAAFTAEVVRRAGDLAHEAGALLAEKRARRAADEAEKPLAHYRAEELAQMRRNFFGFDPSYHVARYNFVRKVPKSRTPVTLARHRDKRRMQPERAVS
ncbi:enoyl-CoA hydratase-related protein [Profundibacter sp.]|uniref:enoyl-CoA hydratase-related protein n=1 Tax=Profundibacter sp. TaxID=3101071 RepID=UPI003D11977F